MKKIVWMVVTVIMFGGTTVIRADLESQRGKAFLKQDGFKTSEEYAKLIEMCDKDSMNLSCSEIVRLFNEAHSLDFGLMKDKDELAKFIREETIVKPCPPTVTPVTIARVIDGKGSFFPRLLRKDEQCVFHLASQVYLASAGCGQWFKANPPKITKNYEAPIGDAVRNAGNGITGDRSTRREGGESSRFGFLKNLKKKKVWIPLAIAAAGAGMWALRPQEEILVESSTSVTVNVGR